MGSGSGDRIEKKPSIWLRAQHIGCRWSAKLGAQSGGGTAGAERFAGLLVLVKVAVLDFWTRCFWKKRPKFVATLSSGDLSALRFGT